MGHLKSTVSGIANVYAEQTEADSSIIRRKTYEKQQKFKEISRTYRYDARENLRYTSIDTNNYVLRTLNLRNVLDVVYSDIFLMHEASAASD